MRILIACDSFKGSLDSIQAAAHISSGIYRVFPDAAIYVVPMADGGEGTASVLTAALGGTLYTATVSGPYGDLVEADFGVLPGGEAIMDMASASGFTLSPDGKRDILSATTYGTGQLIKAALDKGCRHIYLGIGGSATNDGGLGMAQALGACFIDHDSGVLGASSGSFGASSGSPGASNGSPGASSGVLGASSDSPGASSGSFGASNGVLGAGNGVLGAGNSSPGASNGVLGANSGSPGASSGSPGASNGSPGASSGSPGAAPPAYLLAGKHLAHVAAIDLSRLDPRLAGTAIDVLCDVTNPLCGPTGASFVYGPQKGAGPDEVSALDKGLANLSRIVLRNLGLDIAASPGAGAAGGLGFGLMAFLGARLTSGVDFISKATGLDEKIHQTDLIVTGEGRLDRQSAHGKTLVGILRKAAAAGVPVVSIVGAIDGSLDALYQEGLSAAEAAVSAPMSLDEAMSTAGPRLEDAAERLMRAIALGAKLPIMP